jgi:hypothetical protein
MVPSLLPVVNPVNKPALARNGRREEYASRGICETCMRVYVRNGHSPDLFLGDAPPCAVRRDVKT